MSIFALTPVNIEIAYTLFYTALGCIVLSFYFSVRDWAKERKARRQMAVHDSYRRKQAQDYEDVIDLAPPPVYAQRTRRFAQTDHLDTQRMQQAVGRR